MGTWDTEGNSWSGQDWPLGGMYTMDFVDLVLKTDYHMRHFTPLTCWRTLGCSGIWLPENLAYRLHSASEGQCGSDQWA